MADIRIVDVLGPDDFARIPPCIDQRFDHRTCDYWEDAERGAKASRPSWLAADTPVRRPAPSVADNPFAPPDRDVFENPFAPAARASLPDAFADDDLYAVPLENPFAPQTVRERPLREGVPRKLAMLDRGRGVFGSYAKVLLLDDEPVAYCQFGPLSAYPRATRLRDLYPQLPQSPLPAVITCIATTSVARRHGYAHELLRAVLRDLTERGFSAIEAYPDLTRGANETSGGQPWLWHDLGFVTAVDDERFPVMRLEL
jgi:GNAT superfamily N-acetyltransferase